MRGARIAAIGLACFLSAACNDDPPPVGSDGPKSGDAIITGDGFSRDGVKTGDGAKTGDGVKTGDGAKSDAFKVPDAGGWVVYDGGPIKVLDGGKVIVEDGGLQVICYPTLCAGKSLQCGDCLDNDGDGKVDWRDPECLGPCDNTEGPALEAGVGGVTGLSCGVDCYFDYGNGPGNDDCYWDHRCDPLLPEPACQYNAKLIGGKDCPAVQSQKCNDYCIPYTPNGCDCFGCCTFPVLEGKGPSGGPGYVWIGAIDSSKNGTCTLKDLLDTSKCPRCTPVNACLNPCGKCEVCVGKPVPPPECFAKPADGGIKSDGVKPSDGSTPVPGQCAAGVQPCGLPGQAPCLPTHYCISGCCIKVQID